MTPKTCIFRGFWAQKTISSYSFDRIVLIFFINDVISGFAKVVERCGFHHWIGQTISWGEVVSVFLYLL